ncbi:MAG: glycosyltransferase family 39 protein [Prolixibacteraceae bacterium]|nr:glycosyltransferase family 39 protein [Prolixibacteraceae bacterium]
MFKYTDQTATAILKNAVANKKTYWLIAVILIFTIIRLYVAVHIDLNSEEAQYWTWSKHLQLSYYSKPPMIAYLNWFSTSVFGNTVFGIRINAVIIGLLISVFSYLLSFELFKNQNAAILAALVTNIFPFLLNSSVFFTTDSPLLLFWLCAMLFYWKALETDKLKWWLLFGISLGLGALAKYAMFMILIPLVLFTWQHQREILKSRSFYLSILIGLAIFSPVIYWNIGQNGVGVLHLAHLAGVGNHRHSVGQVVSNVLVFTIGQIAILLPFYQYQKIYRKFRQKTLTKQEAFLILPVIITFLIFLIVSANRESEAYINWAMFAYMGMPVLFSHYALTDHQLKFNLRIILVMTAAFFLFLGLTSPKNTVAPLGKLNPANKLIGWSQLAAKVDSIKGTLPPEGYYVFSSNYHITSELWFYQKGQPETYLLNLNSRMTQFDLWPGIEQFRNDDKIGIFVDQIKISPEVKACFKSILKEDSCIVYSQKSKIDTYYIYLMKGMKDFHKQNSSY